MITPEMRLQMRGLVLAEKLPIETVARRFGVHHSTVRRALEDDTQSEQVASKSIIEPFKPYIVERLTTLPELTASRLILELRDRGFAGSIAVVRRYVAKVRVPHSRKVYLRIETDPGEQAQVDWGLRALGRRLSRPALDRANRDRNAALSRERLHLLELESMDIVRKRLWDPAFASLSGP